MNTLSDDHFTQALALLNKMWWSKDRTREEFATMMKHYIPFVLVDNDTQQLVGFARVMTDEVKYAYIYDVMVEERLRAMGLGKQIMDTILHFPSISRVEYFELTCSPGLTKYYKRFGFTNNYENVVAMRLAKRYKHEINIIN